MILNSYSLQKAIMMKQRRINYENTIQIIPKNNIYTSLTSDYIKTEKKAPEIKNVVAGKKKKSKKGLPEILDLTDLDDIELPDLKVDDSDIEELQKKGDVEKKKKKEEVEEEEVEEEEVEEEEVEDDELVKIEKEEDDEDEPVNVEKPE